MAQTSKHMLEGYRVLDFTQVLAGPTTTRYMAEMGAEVIKVEFAPNGDIARGVPYIRDGRSAYYVQQNRGKKGLCLDLKNPAAAAIIRELIPKVDVLVENYAPGVIGRLGFGYEAVRALNPKVIMCSISTFGQGGPLANRPGYDFIGCAYSGVLSMIGERDGAPSLPGVGLGDITTGVHALSAITAALLHRERTGEGQYVETSLLDCYFSYNDMPVHAASLSGGAISPRRNGAHHFAMAPLGVFNGKRHPILIMAATEHQFVYLCRAMGRPEMPSDPRYCNNTQRMANVEELKRLIQDWFDAMPSDDEVYRLFNEHRVPYAQVLSIEEAMAHPHLREREVVRTVNDRYLGEFEVPGFPLRFSSYERHREMEAPTLGEHNEAVLREYLGYSPERIAALEREGVLHRGER
ncbi:MAG: CaiB/BaiF CoA-transferase family protein [Candidatus Binatus sp.]|uniref:CaiB/BaiF CoA transferase family protein n=1 Tax=Candidatus Binatus sp. TaxID=2811406 RepID=UPI0027211CF0|nr:CaiB/BaiF CoA-transferase family protein [Candidatus Binatus sp.]MDO8433724.1 CaiB/BaiF CoA-transferase family protein [Candidatus Binatus sp.]